MALELYLTERGQADQILRTDGVTVIGSKPWRVRDILPTGISPHWINLYEELKSKAANVGTDPELAIEAIGPYTNREMEIQVYKYGSYNVDTITCMLVPKEDLYVLYDLFSKSGTWVNGERQKPYAERVLEPGDKISFVDKQDPLEIAIRYVDSSQFDRALLVVNPANNLEVSYESVRAIMNALSRRGFVVNHIADVVGQQRLDGVIDKMQALLRHDQQFFFSWSGHGGIYDGPTSSNERDIGLGINEPYQLQGASLFDQMAKIEAKKMMVMECCYGGLLLDHPNKPTRTAIVTATQDEEACYALLLNAFAVHLMSDKSRVEFDNGLIERIEHLGAFRTRGYGGNQAAGLDHTATTRVWLRTDRFGEKK